ncbi:hypothetical protein GCM10027456_76940 [Kineosporia babensis]
MTSRSRPSAWPGGEVVDRVCRIAEDGVRLEILPHPGGEDPTAAVDRLPGLVLRARFAASATTTTVTEAARSRQFRSART